MTGRVIVPLEPEGDRPVILDDTGDAWQRRGDLGTATWFAAVPQLARLEGPDFADPLPFARGRRWVEVAAVFGYSHLVEPPVTDPPPYTGELPEQHPAP